MKKTLMTFLLLLAAQLTQAGDKIQNGGNVIVCKNSAGNVQSVELLDYYELRLSGKKLQFNPALATYAEKLNDLLSRWSTVAPKRMALYISWLNDFEKEAGLYPGIEIPDIPDTGSIVIPKGCEVTPVAFQRRDEDIFPGEKRYVINQDLWNLMNADQKAGLVLHELIYREAIKAQHATSLPTRFFNGFLSSEIAINSEAYFEIVSHMPLRWAEFGEGLIMQIGEVRCMGGFPNPEGGCRFVRTIEYVPGKLIEGRILEIIGPVNSPLLKMTFIANNCKTDSYSGSFEMQFGKSFTFDGCMPIQKVLVPEVLNIELIGEEIFDIHYSTIYHSQGRILAFQNATNRSVEAVLSPGESWITLSDGQKILGITNVNSDSSRILAKNDVWDYDWDKRIYIKNDYQNRKYTFKLKNKDIVCTKKLDEKKIYDCTGIPASFVCQAMVWGGNGENISVTYRPKDLTRLTFEEELSPTGPTMKFSLFMPTGTITSYDKKFGRNKPNALFEDRWVSFGTDDKGTCWAR